MRMLSSATAVTILVSACGRMGDHVSPPSADGNTDALSAKKKRRKHHEQPTQAPVSNAPSGQLPINVPNCADQAGSALVNGSAAPLARAVTHSPVAEGPPVQTTVKSAQKLPESQAGITLLRSSLLRGLCMYAILPRIDQVHLQHLRSQACSCTHTNSTRCGHSAPRACTLPPLLLLSG